MDIDLNAIVAPVFWAPLWDMMAFRHRHYWLTGGRGSTKSSVISIRIIAGIIADQEANALVLRKHKVDLRDSVLEQLRWAIEKLGVGEWFTVSVQPMQITYNPTGQRILFRGLDDPNKSKSIKVAHGYIQMAWFEELDQFDGMEEVGTVLRSVMRGGPRFQALATYNPPMSLASWVNAEAARPVASRLITPSSYRDVPPEWLGPDFLAEAAEMERTQPERFRHVYLGEITGTGSEVFGNLEARPITAEERAALRPSWGLDFGLINDPTALICCALDRGSDTVYILDEWLGKHKLPDKVAEELAARSLQASAIVADIAPVGWLQSINQRGFRLRGCHKAPGWPDEGVAWLRDRHRIVIDPDRTPEAWREFSRYQYKRHPDGELKEEFSDKDNHTIDAVRYALEAEIRDDVGTRSTARPAVKRRPSFDWSL